MACHPPVRQWARTVLQPTAPQSRGLGAPPEPPPLLLMVRLLIACFYTSIKYQVSFEGDKAPAANQLHASLYVVAVAGVLSHTSIHAYIQL